MADAAVKEAPDAEGADGEEGEGASSKKKLSRRTLIIIVAAAVVVLGGGGTTAFLLLKPKSYEAAAAKSDKKGGKEEKGKEAKSTTAQIRKGPDGVLFYTMPDIVVNMQTPDGRPTYLKLKLTLELPDQEGVRVLDPNMPRLQDMFQAFLRELRPEDLSGSQGSYQLRMELLRRVNMVIAPYKVNAVLIEEMLIN